MADIITPNYNFTIPEPYGSSEDWGIKLNANWESIDTVLFNVQTEINSEKVKASIIEKLAIIGL
jgi:hypothetical protein